MTLKLPPLPRPALQLPPLPRPALQLPPLPVLPRPALQLPPLPVLDAPLLQALGSVAARPLFFIWELSDRLPCGKWARKLPLLARSGDSPHAAFERGELRPAAVVLQELQGMQPPPGVAYALGIFIHESQGIWCLDIDSDDWRVPGSLAAQARAHAIACGAFWEVSSSGNGTHLFAHGELPPGLRVKWQSPAGASVELYRTGRAMCLGLSGRAMGSMDAHALPPPWAMRERDGSGADVEIGEGPVAWYGWKGDDDALIARIAADTRTRADALLGVGPAAVTPAQLWAGDKQAICSRWPDAVGKDGRCSEADIALANVLARATGGDLARVQRLMWRSGLVREVWSTNGGKVLRAARKACAWVWGGEPRVWGDTRMQELPPLPVLPAVADVVPAELQEMRGIEGARAAISAAGTIDEIATDVAPRIMAMGLTDIEIEMLANEVKRKADYLNTKLSVAACRKLLKVPTPGSVGKPDWLEDWVYLTSSDTFFYRPGGVELKRQAADAMMRAQELPRGANGKPTSPMELYFDVWRGPMAYGTVYAPEAGPMLDSMGLQLANSFNPDTLPADTLPDAMERLHLAKLQDHVMLVCNRDETNFQLLMGWMASVVLRPGKKIKWAPVIQGVQGSGKSILGTIMRKALGDVIPQDGNASLAGHCKVVLPSDLGNSGGFTDWANGRALTIFEEIYIQGGSKWALANIVKPYITEPIVTINRKGVAGTGDIPNRTNYIAFTNHRDAVPMEVNDRRWFVLFTTMLDAELSLRRTYQEEVYFPALWQAFHSVSAGAIRTWLQQWLSVELPAKAPRTSAKMTMIEEGESQIMEVLRDHIAEIEGGRQVITLEDAKQVVMMAGIKARPVEIRHAIAACGFVRWEGGGDRGRTKIHEGGPKMTLYTVPHLSNEASAKVLLDHLRPKNGE